MWQVTRRLLSIDRREVQAEDQGQLEAMLQTEVCVQRGQEESSPSEPGEQRARRPWQGL